MLRKYLQHRIVDWMQTQIFYNRLNASIKQLLDAAARVSLCNKKPSATYSLVQEMANNGYQLSFEMNKLRKTAGTYQVDAVTTLAALVKAITKRLDTM